MDAARSLQFDIKVSADTGDAQSKLQSLVTSAGSLENKGIQIKADTAGAQSGIRTLVSECGSLESKAGTVGSAFRQSFLESIDGGNSFSASLKSGVGGAFEEAASKAKSFKSDVTGSVKSAVQGIGESVSGGMEKVGDAFKHPIETIKAGLGGAIDGAKGKFTEMVRSAEEAANSAGDMGGKAEGAAGSIREMGGAAGGAKGEVAGLGNEAESSGSKFEKLGNVAKVAGAALGASVTAVGAFAASSVSAGMDFDSSMSQVAATMGKTTAEIGELRDFAMEMGSTTAFSATQAADALNYMALAGYDAETSMGMMPNVLNLAAAGGMELATASDMITDASSALGLNIDETTQMVDKMAAAAASSNTSVAQLGDAILTVGGTATMMAGGTTELSTALGILADSGIKGSEGGTHLRNMLLSLSAPTDDAKGLMEDLGVTAIDANGHFRPLEDTLIDLNKAMDGMSDDQKSATLSKLFNKTDIAAVNALMNQSVDVYAHVGEAIGQCGVEFEKYGTTAEGVTGEIRTMMEMEGMSADEAVKKLTEANELTGKMPMSLEDAKAAVNAYSDSIRENGGRWEELSTKIEGAWANMGSLQETLSGMGMSLGGIQTDLGALGVTSGEFSEMLAESGGNAKKFAKSLVDVSDSGTTYEDVVNALGGDLGTLQTAFDETAGAAQAMADTQLDNLAGDITLFKSALEGAQIVVSDQLTPNLREFVQFGADGISRLTNAFKQGGLSGAMGELGGIISDGVGMIIGAIPTLVNAGMQLLGALGQGIIDNLPVLLVAAVQVVAMLANGIGQGLPQMVPAIIQMVATMAQTLISNVPTLISAGMSLIGGLAEGIVNAIPMAIEAIPLLLQWWYDALTQGIPQMLSMGSEIITTIADGLTQAAPLISEALPVVIEQMVTFFATNVPQIITQIVGFIGTALPAIVEAGVTIITALAQGLISARPQLIAAIPTIITGLVSGIAQNLPMLIESGVRMIVSLVGGLISAIPMLLSAVPEIFSAFGQAIMSTDWIGLGGQIINAIWEGIKSIGSGLFGGIKDLIFGGDASSQLAAAGTESATVFTSSLQSGMSGATVDAGSLGINTSALTSEMEQAGAESSAAFTSSLTSGLSEGLSGTATLGIDMTGITT